MLVIVTAYRPGDDEPIVEDTYRMVSDKEGVNFCERISDLADETPHAFEGKWRECS